MQLALHVDPLNDARMSLRDYDSVHDDIGSVIADVCDALADVARFDVSGFGDAAWPVDVRTDLAVVLAQLPSLLDGLLTGGHAVVLDFFEQGVERCVTFEPRGSAYLATCASRTAWQPSPRQEVISRKDLGRAAIGLARAFMDAVARLAPGLETHALLRPLALERLRQAERQL